MPATGGSGGSGGRAGGSGVPAKPGVATLAEPGAVVTLEPSAEQSAEAARLRGSLAGLEGLDAAGFAERYPSAPAAAPTYARASIAGLDKIQSSQLRLDEAALTQLEQQGMVIVKDRRFPSFAYGYQTLYLEDLPLYVSADSILAAVHRSYDAILTALEQGLLLPELEQLLAGMHAKLAAGTGAALGPAVVRDADVFLAVARSLLRGSPVPPAAGGAVEQVNELVGLAQQASGVTTVELFGVRRENEDFSQFTPRGHYLGVPALERYFRAMIWLGRVDFRLLETQPDGTQLFRRRQLEMSLLMGELIGDDLKPHFDRVDRTVAAFVGEPDYLVLSQLDSLKADLGIGSSSELAGFSDQALAQAIIDGDYGAQRISSHIMINGLDQATLPLSRSFALLGQRYVLDSHVFSNVVYDRIGAGGQSKRMLPDPLDVAFAALQNDQAGALLAPQLEQYEGAGYPSALAQLRDLADAHPVDFWHENLYNSWLGALRQLSPSATSAAADASSLPPAARSEAWGKRLLNTQLASWSELRHDTILYVKQSYTAGAACEFPDAYVDPYPGFFAAIDGYGQRGTALLDELDLTALNPELRERIATHFALVSDVAQRLGEMAEHERTGAEFTPEMLAFINDAVEIAFSCDGSGALQAGWYKSLFFDAESAARFSPTVADVHTQPTDEGGNLVGNVLHVASGAPRLMVAVAEGCSGPRAYAGLVSAYHELVETNFKRLDDIQWSGRAYEAADVPWLDGVISK